MNATGLGARSGQQAATSCVTSAYTTVTGCSATPAATTVRTTSTVSQSESEPTCEPETCGGSECPALPRRELLDEHEHAGLLKRGNPAEGEWPDPSDYVNPDSFIGRQLIAIRRGLDPSLNGGYDPVLVPHGDVAGNVPRDRLGITTANHILFKSRVAAIALEGLYGCTSVVVVSRRGAWVSHIWERDMTLEDQFQKKVIGDDEESTGIKHAFKEWDPAFEFFEYGLEDMVENPEDRRVGFTFGDVLPSGADEEDDTLKTPKDLGTRAFIFTPRHRLASRYKDDGTLMDESEFLDNIDFHKGTVRNGLRVARLSGLITDLFEGIPVEVVDYMPLPLTNEMHLRFDRLADERNAAKRPETADEARRRKMEVWNYMDRKQLGTPRGKLLLQYKPAKTCNDKAAWRLWIENQGVERRSDEWTPERGQVFGDPDSDSDDPDDSDGLYDSDDIYGSGPPLRRRHEACPMPTTKTAGSASKTPVTSQAKSTPTLSRTAPFPTTRSLNQTATVPGKPTSTSTPTAGVAILYELDSGADEGGGRVGQWQIFQRGGPNAIFDACRTSHARCTLQVTGPQAVSPWPPNFDATSPVHGRNGCRYYGRADGPGRFSCEGVAQFDCVKDPSFDPDSSSKSLDCESGSKKSSLFPRVVCWLPEME